jgi:hypothetical protein
MGEFYAIRLESNADPRFASEGKQVFRSERASRTAFFHARANAITNSVVNGLRHAVYHVNRSAPGTDIWTPVGFAFRGNWNWSTSQL